MDNKHRLIDPYIKLSLGDFHAQTDTRQEGGSDVTFDDLGFTLHVTRDILLNGSLVLEAWDENASMGQSKRSRDVLIGTPLNSPS